MTSAPAPDDVLTYGEGPDAVVDLFLPADEPQAVLFHVHGGFWRQAYDRDHARPFARAMADLGYAVALPEYRRVGGGGGWPTTCDDVRRALDAALADPRLAGRRTLVSGHSAGGHLALWLAGTGAPVDGVVAIAPVGDLRDALATRMGDGAAAAFLGSEEPVDAADPARLLDEHRPAYGVTVVHGTADDAVPIANTRGLVARHPWIDLVELPDVDHHRPVTPGDAALEQVVSAYARVAG